MPAVSLFYAIIKLVKLNGVFMDQSKKSIIRQEMKEFRNALDVFTIESMSDDIYNGVLELDLIAYETFFVYNSFGSEVQTQKIIDHLLENNKKVYLPRIEGQVMQSVLIDSDTEFNKNGLGILEPIGDHDEINDFVAIIPCLAVDKRGNRIGYGKGYYDKFLQNKKAMKIILCYDFQVIDDINPEEFDIPADLILTEKRKLDVEWKK